MDIKTTKRLSDLAKTIKNSTEKISTYRKKLKTEKDLTKQKKLKLKIDIEIARSVMKKKEIELITLNNR